MSIEINHDFWIKGRSLNGRYTPELMRKHYPHIRVPTHDEYVRVRSIVEEYIPKKPDGLRPYRSMTGNIFFERQEDCDLVKTLMLVL